MGWQEERCHDEVPSLVREGEHSGEDAGNSCVYLSLANVARTGLRGERLSRLSFDDIEEGKG
jgi:hypothetical protein